MTALAPISATCAGELTALEIQVGAQTATEASHYGNVALRLDRIEGRLDRIERQLDLADAPA